MPEYEVRGDEAHKPGRCGDKVACGVLVEVTGGGVRGRACGCGPLWGMHSDQSLANRSNQSVRP